MAAMLDELRWNPRWVSQMGCLEGCLRYLGKEISPGWLYGGSGWAFAMNLGENLCPSGPHSWPNGRIIADLGKNLGIDTEVLGGGATEHFSEDAWQLARKAIDEGAPCYTWHYEYHVIRGYDERGYHVDGPPVIDSRAAFPWQKLGDSPRREVFAVRLGEEGDPTITGALLSDLTTHAGTIRPSRCRSRCRLRHRQQLDTRRRADTMQGQDSGTY